MTTRHNYDQELEGLRGEILKMGEAVSAAISDAVQSLAKQNEELARKVIANDDIIDKMEIDIEDHCMVLIARQQPLARDLRVIGTGMKIATDLERMGDHAYDIANVTLRIANQPLLKPLVDIPRMAEMAQKMLNDALRAYVNLDTQLAEAVCHADDEVDYLYQQVFRELLTYMFEDPRTISQATQLIFVARYLERVADHATNIAEWIIYLATGQRLRTK
ncbi:phosphate transport system protein [Anaerospora hongkongensis]|uniref:Phosphate-specific transport system accessory protein PhoU n=1 Tax=Anaerospora hongkongensis TaxID=244830 RepID=A0A4R1Q5C3_9FIRM|nr:phosphate signaling complex protein PhoU [Anaerospora hongkongensis]TCL40252.1 phosphate transport system protein [Anaerospora hongkongensis]